MLPDNTKHPQLDLLEHIHHSLKRLVDQLADFKEVLRDRKIVSFYETAQTKEPEFVSGLSQEDA
jgi:hypothetical protein